MTATRAIGCGGDRLPFDEILDPLSQFRCAETRSVIHTGIRTREPGLQIIPQRSQFREVGFMDEWVSESCLVVAQLRLGETQVLLESLALGVIGTG